MLQPEAFAKSKVHDMLVLGTLICTVPAGAPQIGTAGVTLAATVNVEPIWIVLGETAPMTGMVAIASAR